MEPSTTPWSIARGYGADEGINYSNESVKERIKVITEGRGADVIFDPVGGDVFDESLRSIAPDGRIAVIGFASGRIPAIPANLVLLKNCAVVGVYWEGFAKREPRKNRANFEAMFRWFEPASSTPRLQNLFAPRRSASHERPALPQDHRQASHLHRVIPLPRAFGDSRTLDAWHRDTGARQWP